MRKPLLGAGSLPPAAITLTDAVCQALSSLTLGAAGAIEAIFSLLAIRDGVVPPTLNLDNPERETVVDLVPHVARRREINVALSNSFGFGGTNASLVLRRFA
jgi:3-oxoacyl-[acyl-carrier-protein] synthase II